MIKKILAIILVASFILPSTAMGRSNKPKANIHNEIYTEAPGSPDIKAKDAILIDAKSGQILYGLNMNNPVPPASTTKILTGIIAIERSNLDEMVTITDAVRTVDGTHIALQPGEKIKMKDLLFAMLLNSANDAAVAIAEHISGSVEKFAILMNEKALELGAKNSNFVNPNGLPNPKHNTTAYDLAMITRYAMQNPTFRQIVGTSSYEIGRDKPNSQRYLYNHNKLIQPNSYYRYPGSTGVKTGYTNEARQCIVASAKRDNREYIAVVLGSETIWDGPAKLLDYAFNQFHSVNVIQPGEFVQSIGVKDGTEKANMVTKTGFSFSLPKEENKIPEKKVIIDPGIKAPIKAGQRLGQIEYYYKGKKVGSVDLVAQKKVNRKLAPGSKSWRLLTIIGAIIALILIAFRYRGIKKSRHRKLNRLW